MAEVESKKVVNGFEKEKIEDESKTEDEPKKVCNDVLKTKPEDESVEKESDTKSEAEKKTVEGAQPEKKVVSDQKTEEAEKTIKNGSKTNVTAEKPEEEKEVKSTVDEEDAPVKEVCSIKRKSTNGSATEEASDVVCPKKAKIISNSKEDSNKSIETNGGSEKAEAEAEA